MTINVGIGTVKGTGTSGYVQKNRAYVKPTTKGVTLPSLPHELSLDVQVHLEKRRLHKILQVKVANSKDKEKTEKQELEYIERALVMKFPHLKPEADKEKTDITDTFEETENNITESPETKNNNISYKNTIEHETLEMDTEPHNKINKVPRTYNSCVSTNDSQEYNNVETSSSSEIPVPASASSLKERDSFIDKKPSSRDIRKEKIKERSISRELVKRKVPSNSRETTKKTTNKNSSRKKERYSSQAKVTSKYMSSRRHRSKYTR